MDATVTTRGPSNPLEFDHPHVHHSNKQSSYLDGEAHLTALDGRDFDTFVEEQLHDGTGSLYADATSWMERRLLVRVLAQTNGNKSKACQILGITRGSLRHKICQHGISIHQTVRVVEADGR
jgi:DNA-binding protein Fis